MDTAITRNREAELREAFARAEYRVSVLGKEWLVRAGERQAGLEQALGCRRWAILTAHNPGGRRIDADENRRRETALRTAIRQRGWRSFEAINRDPDGHWPDEPGLLVADAPTDAIGALARHYGQAAIVTAGAGERARVEFLDRATAPTRGAD